jgi:hypothetical protein
MRTRWDQARFVTLLLSRAHGGGAVGKESEGCDGKFAIYPFARRSFVKIQSSAKILSVGFAAVIALLPMTGCNSEEATPTPPPTTKPVEKPKMEPTTPPPTTPPAAKTATPEKPKM